MAINGIENKNLKNGQVNCQFFKIAKKKDEKNKSHEIGKNIKI